MHQPSGGIGGTASDIRIQAEQSLHMKHRFLELIAEHSGRPFEQIEHDADRDRYFTAAEAWEYGLIDHVVTNAHGGGRRGAVRSPVMPETAGTSCPPTSSARRTGSRR